MKITIPHDLKGKELTKFLIGNKDALIAQKKALPKFTDGCNVSAELFHVKGSEVIKSDTGSIPEDATSIHVKVVANTALWVDSQMDVLLPGCWDKSIADRKGMIPHLHDHVHTLDAQVGDVKNIYKQSISLASLGLNKMGNTEALIFETDIKKSYNEKVFNLYKSGKVNQHSIGLQYVKIGLAINDEEAVANYDLWKKHYDSIINKQIADEKGFFWAVSEIKLLENSAVLFGANELTPTLETSTGKSAAESTDNQPPSFNVSEAIKTTTFFN